MVLEGFDAIIGRDHFRVLRIHRTSLAPLGPSSAATAVTSLDHPASSRNLLKHLVIPSLAGTRIACL
jgi:hypothetical protein